MATKDEQEVLRLLVQYVARAFYEPRFVVILDQLARHPVLKDDDLAGRIGLQAKELNKLMAVLTNDRLVHVYRQNELKEGAQRSIGRQYYYVDFQHFCNVVKWRVAEMRRIIDSTLRNELGSKGYICPNCKATFSPLEVDHLIDYMLGVFLCNQCTTSPGGPHELILNEDEKTTKGNNDRMERFNHQTKFIQEGLRKTEAMTLPAFDVSIWIKANVHDAERHKQAQNGGLKIAGADGKREEVGISVLMSVDKDEATRRREREEEADAKRQQNILPSWHLKSTITNDLTALGVAAANQQAKKMSGNEAILSSLSKSSDALAGYGKVKPKVESQLEVVEEEKKPIVDHTADFYDHYYASLEAASQAQSASQTPVLDPFIGDFDEEDRKPNVAYLDALNANRKRSRSLEDESEKGSKLLRSNAGTPVFSQSSQISSAVTSPSPFTDTSFTDMEGSTELMTSQKSLIGGDNEPMISVGGMPMPFSQVTQEIADEKMTDEEYTAWYDMLMTQ